MFILNRFRVILCLFIQFVSLVATIEVSSLSQSHAAENDIDERETRDMLRPRLSKASRSNEQAGFKWDNLFPIDKYIVGTGDMFRINIWGGVIAEYQVYIDAFGRGIIPGVGSLNAGGLSLAEFEKQVKKLVRKRYPNAESEISLIQSRAFNITMTGLVESPGIKSVTQLTRLSDLLEDRRNLAQGASTIDIDIRNEKTKKNLRVNYQEFLLKENLFENPYLQEGDVIFVPKRKNMVEIRGLVGRPGYFQFSEPTVSLKKIVNEYFWGVGKPLSDDTHISISRLENGQRKSFRYSWKDFFSMSPPNFETLLLQDGDQIYFSDAAGKQQLSEPEILVTGEVKRPGVIPYRPGASVMQYIGLAGGVSNRANMDRIEIYRGDGKRVNAHPSAPLEPGDAIYVPEKTFKFWQDHIVILTTLLGIVTTTIAISR